MVTIKQVKALLKEHFEITGSVKITDEGVVNVYGDVGLANQISELPVSFGIVHGDFDCNFNALASLVGSPDHVDGSFICNNNQLTSLQGAPRYVLYDFDCSENNLSTLEGAPDHVGGNFWCNTNKLTSLQGAPAYVGGTFFCTYNAHLPLLRLSMYNNVAIGHAPAQAKQIMDTYVGQGKVGAIKAAAELIRAGYKENARW